MDRTASRTGPLHLSSPAFEYLHLPGRLSQASLTFTASRFSDCSFWAVACWQDSTYLARGTHKTQVLHFHVLVCRLQHVPCFATLSGQLQLRQILLFHSHSNNLGFFWMAEILKFELGKFGKIWRHCLALAAWGGRWHSVRLRDGANRLQLGPLCDRAAGELPSG